MALAQRANILTEAKAAGFPGEDFDVFQPTSFTSQVVAGMNYRIQIQIADHSSLHVTMSVHCLICALSCLIFSCRQCTLMACKGVQGIVSFLFVCLSVFLWLHVPGFDLLPIIAHSYQPLGGAEPQLTEVSL